ncbi:MULTISPECIES: GNAT family N-acetyltransferase [Methylobacterium]|uniref:GNAT family N-acetyltransferase n=1 Tax=Methylobacterium TaxID=407 RepID=UPI0013EC68CB|nr:GNAT family N-acetyltransferase [Methylobacterium sp. DB0501]NGM34684.1 GNAT family N-acetyltransferase [Methylobacterium sp. DB0501]
MHAFEIRRLGAADGPAYRALRLEALERHPESFGTAFEDVAGHGPDWFGQRLEQGITLGAFRDGALAGAVTLVLNEGAKLRHKGDVVAVYLRPAARGLGLGAALLNRLVDEARPRVEALRLTVEAGNGAALRLYERLGFRAYGRERRALKIGGRYHDEVLMELVLADDSTRPHHALESTHSHH